ncbi:DUF4349 domain-containing protein [Chryseobacterium luteum]|uniref:DUF4349 domain-containing protein n=1 Tax=Chryseobacterium luteum TaxID=421531 RepID=A0A085ZGQ4_9FLAO|nr:DUF4349 domain-containing protein [Chryseobacterium luteum]KFF03618.1 hypothetical protein IX38_11670 [Chryseobacterium luteum]
MKKFILLLAVSGTFIMCKKGETTESRIKDTLHSADSAAAAVNETVNSIGNTTDKVLDSANIRIKDFEDAKGEIQQKMENTSRMVDSLTDKIASTKLESKIEKKDSAEKKTEKIVVNVPAPKVIKETKIIYKDKPKNDSYELKNKMVKTGLLSVKADNAETVKQLVKEETIKNNGYVKSEELSYITTESADRSSSYEENSQRVYYMDIKVPIRNFDGLMDDLSDIGDIETKNIQVSGNNYSENTLCTITVTLTDKSDYEKEPKTFGDKSLAAVSSGWNVITSAFLFLLPLWPLFLIGGIGYYFYKKKKQKKTDGNSQ